MSTSSAQPAHAHVQLTGVTKRYGGVTALDSVDFACDLGSVHAVLGENVNAEVKFPRSAEVIFPTFGIW
jgi:ABC-type uncharacterized transport system ATPase subunit